MSTANVPSARAQTLNFSEACTRHGSAEQKTPAASFLAFLTQHVVWRFLRMSEL